MIVSSLISRSGSSEQTIERQVADRTKEGDMTWEALMDFVFGAPSTQEDIDGLNTQKEEITKRRDALKARRDEFMTTSPQMDAEIAALVDNAYGYGAGMTPDQAREQVYKNHGVEASMMDLDNQIVAYDDQLAEYDAQIAQLRETGEKDRQPSYYEILSDAAQKIGTVIDTANEAYKNEVAIPRDQLFQSANKKYEEILGNQKASQAEVQAGYQKQLKAARAASTPINVSFGGSPLATVLPHKNYIRSLLGDYGNFSNASNVNSANILQAQTGLQDQYLSGKAGDVMVPVDLETKKQGYNLMPQEKTIDLLKSIAIPTEGMRYQGGTTTASGSTPTSVPEILLGGSIISDWYKELMKPNVAPATIPTASTNPGSWDISNPQYMQP
jgi:hypothetical protein